MDDTALRHELNDLRALIERERSDRETMGDDIRRAVKMDLGPINRRVERLADEVRLCVDYVDQHAQGRPPERVAPERAAGWRQDWRPSWSDSGGPNGFGIGFWCQRPVDGARQCTTVVPVLSGDTFISLSNKLRKHVRTAHPGAPGIR